MFGLFSGDPTKKMRKQYDKLLEQGMQAQRNGDMRSYAKLTEEAEALWAKIAASEKQGS